MRTARVSVRWLLDEIIADDEVRRRKLAKITGPLFKHEIDAGAEANVSIRWLLDQVDESGDATLMTEIARLTGPLTLAELDVYEDGCDGPAQRAAGRTKEDAESEGVRVKAWAARYL